MTCICYSPSSLHTCISIITIVYALVAIVVIVVLIVLIAIVVLAIARTLFTITPAITPFAFVTILASTIAAFVAARKGEA